jgi:hypothetical protein
MRERAGLGAMLLVVAVAWLTTLSPGVRVSDDVGALQAVCATFGVAHPTGFPLWTLACGAFARVVPFGSFAWRANLFSAACGLAALVPLFVVLRRLGAGVPLAAAGGLAFAALPVAWRVAVVAEVYHLHLLLAATAWAGVLQWRAGRGEKWLWMAVLAACLGVGVHPMMALTAPGLLLAVVVADRRAAARALPVGVAALLLALLPHAWLWTRVQDPATPLRYLHGADLPAFLAYARGAQFSGEMLAGTPGGALLREVGLQTLAAAGASVALLGLPDRPVRAGMLLAAALHAGFALTYGIGELGPYVLPVAWLGGVGLVAAAARVPRAGWVAGPLALGLLALNRGAAQLGQAREDQQQMRELAERVEEDGVVLVRHWPWVGAAWAQALATAEGGPAVLVWGRDRGPVTAEALRAALDAADRLPHQPGALPQGGAWLLGPGFEDRTVGCAPVDAALCRVTSPSVPPDGARPGTR